MCNNFITFILSCNFFFIFLSFIISTILNWNILILNVMVFLALLICNCIGVLSVSVLLFMTNSTKHWISDTEHLPQIIKIYHIIFEHFLRFAAGLSTSLSRSENLLFSEFISKSFHNFIYDVFIYWNIVSTLPYTYIKFLILLYTFSVISFA